MASTAVSIIIGTDSDLPVMQQGAKVLNEVGVTFEITIVSAHRIPKRLYKYSEEAEPRGIKAIIAGAGGAAHPPRMVAAISPLQEIGLPIKSSNSIDGRDSILQMPGGVPVATVAINGAKNAVILEVQILSTSNQDLQNKVKLYKQSLNNEVLKKNKKMKKFVFKY